MHRPRAGRRLAGGARAVLRARPVPAVPNPEVDRLCEEQETEIDEARRKETVARIQRLIAEDLPILPLVYPTSFAIFNWKAFDQWSYTAGGVAGTVPTVENKALFVTGRKTGLEIRPFQQGS